MDESTNVATNAQLVVHLWCVKSGRLSTRFGGIEALGEKTAAAIRTAVENKCQDFHVQWKTCQLSTDGASVFTGCKTGVNKQLLDAHDTRYSLAIHCVCHREALACADAVKCVSYLEDKVQPALGGVYRQFGSKPPCFPTTTQVTCPQIKRAEVCEMAFL